MHVVTRRPGARMRSLMLLRPTTPGALHRFVERGLGLRVGRVAVAAGSSAPFDYLVHSYFEGSGAGAGSGGGDCVVWANRGGGKTMLGAVATLLDLLFKPGVQVRILGGSLEQSGKMYEHLTALLERPLLREGGGVLRGPATARRVVLQNGSRVELLAGSQRSVRGVRVHKLRCDEVEEFDPAVWEAAQLVTRSARLADGTMVRGTVEALSTMHRPMGLMADLVRSAEGTGNSAGGAGSDVALPRRDAEVATRDASRSAGRRVFRWNAMDVVARCPEERACEGCVLWGDCGGRAKVVLPGEGFVPVEDLVAQWKRTSDRTWETEMMCRRPGVVDAVYPGFDPAPGEHVIAVDPPSSASGVRRFVGGMDFGMRCPHVMLWAAVADAPDRPGEAAVHVVDEYVATDLALDRHLDAIAAQAAAAGWPGAGELAWVGVDPAGRARDRHSGLSDIAVLRRHGYRVRHATSRIATGVDLVRRRLDRGTLTIHPRCSGLIDAMTGYRFDPARPGREEPLKDGPDHLCDALRYLLVNLESGGRARFVDYLHGTAGAHKPQTGR